jgi:hypothetical protein
MVGPGYNLGSGGSRGRGRTFVDFGEGFGGDFEGGYDDEEWDEADFGEQEGGDEGDGWDDEGVGFQVDASAVGGAVLSSQQRGHGRRFGARGRRGASFASRCRARPAIKGINFQAKEEVQLTRNKRILENIL